MGHAFTFVMTVGEKTFTGPMVIVLTTTTSKAKTYNHDKDAARLALLPTLPLSLLPLSAFGSTLGLQT